MAELSDVTKPLIGAHRVHSGARDEFYVLAEQAVEMLDKMGDEGGDCLAPLAKRRNQDCRGIYAVVEVVAELSRLHHRAQVTISGRDDPNINRVGTRGTDGLDLVRLDCAQQLGLQLERELADFVQKQGSAIGGAEIAEGILAGIGESAEDMTEELRLGQ